MKDTRSSLLAASMITIVGFYSFAAQYQIVHFKSSFDTGKVLEQQKGRFMPENEIPVYERGWAVLFILTPLLVLFFQILLKPIPIQLHQKIVRIFMYFIGLLTVFFVSLTVFTKYNFISLFVSYCIFYILILLFHFRKVYTFPRLLDALQTGIEWFIGTLVLGSIGYILVKIISAKSQDILVSSFRAYAHVYLTQLPPIEVVVTSLILFCLFYWSLTRKKIIFISKNKHFFYTLLFILVISVIVYSVSLFGFPHGYIFDQNQYLGPINDVLGGKTLLVNAYSQYGLLLIYSLVPFFKIIPLSYEHIVFLNAAVYIVGYSLIFLILWYWVKNTYLALFGIYLILLEHFFTEVGSMLAYSQASFIRFGSFIPLSLWILIKPQISLSPRVKTMLEALFVGYAVFWGFDVGVYILGSYLAYISVSSWLGHTEIRDKLHALLMNISYLLGSLALYFGVITVFLYRQAHSWPDWRRFIGTAFEFMNGWDMIKLDPFGPYLFVIALLLFFVWYISSQVFSRVEGKSNTKERNIPLLAFLTVFTILSFVYYLGRSVGGALHVVSVPIILLFCYFLKIVSEKIRDHGGLFSFPPSMGYVLSTSSILLFLVLGLILSAGHRNLVSAYAVRKASVDFPHYDTDENIQQSVKAINDSVEVSSTGMREIGLITRDDTYFLVKTRTVNAIESNNIYFFNFKFQFDILGKQVLQAPVRTFFIQHIRDSDEVEILYRYLSAKYRFVKNVGFLDQWERI